MSNLSLSAMSRSPVEKTSIAHASHYFDSKYQLMWCYMHATPRPCVTPSLLQGLEQCHNDILSQKFASKESDVRYMVLASSVPGVYNLGGDLSLLMRSVQDGNREALTSYVERCVSYVFNNYIELNNEVTTISLVQGDALGGGLEAAMSCNVLIAERGAKLGIPDILFNLFPGAGAYSFISRKVGSAQADRIILSGKLYTAEEFFEMGIVDVLAESGQGEKAVYDYIAKENKARNTYLGMRKIKNLRNPITREELIEMAHVWVDAAMNLQPRDLRMMERLISRQTLRAQAAV